MTAQHIIRTILFAAIAITLIPSCTKTDTPAPDPTAGLVRLASGNVIGTAAKVEVYAKDSAFTGYNQLFIALRDSATNAFIEDAHVMLMPMMTMMGMNHSAPKEDPAEHMAVNKLFPGSVTFIMPSTAGNWTLDVDIHNHLNDKEGSVTLPISVKDPSSARMFSFVSLEDNTSKYFVSFIPPSKPVVGLNDLEVVVTRKASMMSFPADSSLTLSFVPTMPSMGHSSPNNVDPVHLSQGHYKGKVNFTMTGTWRLSFRLNHGAAVVDSTHYVDFTF